MLPKKFYMPQLPSAVQPIVNVVKKCANSSVSISHSEPENVKKSSPKNSWNEMIIIIKEIFLTIFDTSLNSVQFSGPLGVFMSHFETNVNHCAKFLIWITHPTG